MIRSMSLLLHGPVLAFALLKTQTHRSELCTCTHVSAFAFRVLLLSWQTSPRRVTFSGTREELLLSRINTHAHTNTHRHSDNN